MRGLSLKTKTLIEYAYGLLDANRPMTLRQLHYAIFSGNEIGYNNTQADYKRLSRATTVARRSHREWELYSSGLVSHNLQEFTLEPPKYGIPSHWMVDETREGERVSLWTNKDEYIEIVRNAYRRDNWQDQANYCEVWSEKATVLGSVRPVAKEYGITLRVCHGFGSTGMESQVGGVFESIGKPITVFFLGDHDPSGHVIEQDMHRRVQAASGIDFEMVRLAIHAADIAKFNLPPQTIKKSDSRAASFERRFGAAAATVELDALPAAELRRRIDVSVVGLIDPEAWKRQIAVQEVELRCIAEFADRVKNLPQVPLELAP